MKFLLPLLLFACVFPVCAEPVFSCTGKHRGNLQFDAEAMPLKLRFRNNGTFSGKYQEVLRFCDFYGNGDAPEVREITLSGNQEIVREFTVPAEKMGCYRLIYSIMQNGKILFQKSVNIGKFLPVVPLNPEKSCFGIYCHLPGYNGERDFPGVKNTGFSLVRTDMPWSSVQPKQDVWNWEQHDRCIALAQKYGLDITWNLLYSPSWAVKVKNGYGGDPADYNIFAEFARRAVARYPQVTYWSIWNESDAESHWTGGAKEFAKMLKTVVPPMRRENAKIRILPGGVTGLIQLAAPFMRELGKQNAGEYFDIYDFHYTGLETHQKIAAEMKWKKPFWNTELSGGIGERLYRIPREAALSFANGLERMILFLWTIRMTNPAHVEEFGNVVLVDNNGAPSPLYPVIYTLNAKFNGFNNFQNISAGPLKAVRMVRSGKQSAVCWNTDAPKSTIPVKTSVPLTATTADGVAFELVPQNGYCFVPANDFICLEAGNHIVTPVPGKGAAAFEPLKTTPVYGQKFCVTATVHNPQKQQFEGKLKLQLPGDWKNLSGDVKLSLAPGKVQKVTFEIMPRSLTDLAAGRLFLVLENAKGNIIGFDKKEISLTVPLAFELSPAFQWGRRKVRAAVNNTTAETISAEIHFQTAEKSVKMPFAAKPMTTTYVYFTPAAGAEKVRLTATLSAAGVQKTQTADIVWHSIPSRQKVNGKANVTLNKRTDVVSSSDILYEWEGKDDLSCEAKLYWVPEFLVLEADVTDDILQTGREPGALWMRDSLQVYFNGTLYEFGLCNGKAVYFCNGKEPVKPLFEVSRQGNITRYTVKFPKENGGKWKANDTVQYAFIVNDSDKDRREGWLVFRSDIGDVLKRRQTEISTLNK